MGDHIMSTLEGTLPAARTSLGGRLAMTILALVEARFGRPSTADGERPDDETMMQVALICSAHF